MYGSRCTTVVYYILPIAPSIFKWNNSVDRLKIVTQNV